MSNLLKPELFRPGPVDASPNETDRLTMRITACNADGYPMRRLNWHIRECLNLRCHRRSDLIHFRFPRRKRRFFDPGSERCEIRLIKPL